MAQSRARVRRPVALFAAVAVLASAGYSFAQFRSRGFDVLGTGSGLAPKEFPDRDFVVCRLVYSEGRRFAGGWRTDYPLGDRNLSIRFGELTKTRVSTSRDGSRNHYLVRISDDQLFQCPFLIAGDVGSATISPAEAERLRAYFLKGGFLWADDFWGTDQWEQWVEQLRKVLPASEYPIADIALDHPMLRAQFVVTEIPQIPNIGYFRRSGGDTSERGYDSETPTARIITGPDQHVMVLMTHNTDISDSWEREGEDVSYFYAFSPRGYAFGINVLLYAMTH